MKVWRALVVVGVVLVVMSMGGLAIHQPARSTSSVNLPANGSGTDVLLVHGYSVGNSGTSGPSIFQSGVNIYQQLVSEGYNVGIVSYYGYFTVTFSNGYTYTDSSFYGTANTPIQDVSAEMAKFITQFTASAPVTMDIVAHSMGGLVTMYMLENYQFPNVDLKNVITIATPFGGSPFASIVSYLGLDIFVGYQADQMAPGSSFLTDLQSNLGSAYGTYSHTVWIVYAGNYDPWWGYLFFSGDNDGVVSVRSAASAGYDYLYYFNDLHTSFLDSYTWSGISYFEDQAVANTISANLAGSY